MSKVEHIPSKVQEYKNLEETEDGKPVWAFICPDETCQHENRMKGDPTEFMNRPYKCLKCGYVPLLGKENLQEFIELNKTLKEGDSLE